MIIKGAYGKTYNNIISAKDAWDRNKDFKVVGGPYINRSDWEKYSDEETVLFEAPRGGMWVIEESDPHNN